MKRSSKRQLAKAAKKRARAHLGHKRPNPAAFIISKPLTDDDLVRMHRDMAWANLFRSIIEVMPYALAKFKVTAEPEEPKGIM